MLAGGVAAPLVGGLGLAAGRAWADGAPVKPPSIEELVRKPVTIGAALSPDGHQIAVLHQKAEGEKHIAYVTLIDAANPDAKPAQIVIGPYEVSKIQWANNERLLVTVMVERKQAIAVSGSYMRETVDFKLRRLLSITRAGEPVLLLNDNIDLTASNTDLSQVVDLLPDDPNHILMMLDWDPRVRLPALHKVDITTGGSALVEAGVDNTYGFATVKGVPVLRWDALTTRTSVLYARALGETGWKVVRKIRIGEKGDSDFEVKGLAGDDPNQWLALVSKPEQPLADLHTLDLKTLALGEPSGLPTGEIIDTKFDTHQRYFASQLSGDRAAYDFADKTLAGHFKAMNKFFDNQCSIEIIDWNPTQTRLLVLAQGPTEAGVYYFYDREARRFDALDEQRPWLRDRLAKVEALDLKTRDGVAMRAYLTVPIASAGAGPRPLIVMPHGGPEAHDTLRFDFVAQAFAARGWMVLQPNFRGSTGYGDDFALAGRRHWGDRMQEDVEDAVFQVLASGRADPQRVAIWGGSYGGYAALMGAVRKPDLYKAVVSLAGIGDLLEFLAVERGRETEDSPTYQFWRSQMGDPATDTAMMTAASPRRRAAEVKAPVLLLHGNKDDIVDPNQSRMMADALKAAGKKVEYVVLEQEGHHWSDWKDKTMTLMLTRSCDFLAAALA